MNNDTKTYTLTEMDYSILNSMCKCCLELKSCKNPFCKKKKLALWVMKCSKDFKKQGYKHIAIDESKFFTMKLDDLNLDYVQVESECKDERK